MTTSIVICLAISAIGAAAVSLCWAAWRSHPHPRPTFWQWVFEELDDEEPSK